MKRRSTARSASVKPRRRKAAVKGRNAPKSAQIAGAGPKLAQLVRERNQALEQLSAASEVLKIISASPSDLRPVFDALAENAARLCHGFDVYIQLREGNLVRYVAHYGGVIPISPLVGETRPLTRDLVIGRAMLESRLIHLLDAQAEAEEFPEGSAIARRTGYRSIIAVPLMRQGYAIGTIAVRRVEARFFSDKEVELLSNFAAQAVIAIENARLLTELRQRTADLSETLEQQTATFEVLKVISSSPGKLEPVFRAILENATRICGAKIGILFRFDDGAYTAVATLGVTAEYNEYLSRGPVRGGPGTGLGRIAANCPYHRYTRRTGLRRPRPSSCRHGRIGRLAKSSQCANAQ
jgi:hypothetical protein